MSFLIAKSAVLSIPQMVRSQMLYPIELRARGNKIHGKPLKSAGKSNVSIISKREREIFLRRKRILRAIAGQPRQ
jgi:hypothetical protein